MTITTITNVNATQSKAGLMSPSDKTKLDDITSMTAAQLTAGTSTTSMLVSPKVIADYVDAKIGTIASGSY